MRLVAVAVAMAGLIWWESPNLRRWGAGERWAFWVAWGLMVAWAVALQARVPVPSFAQAQVRLVDPLIHRFLKPMPNPYW